MRIVAAIVVGLGLLGGWGYALAQSGQRPAASARQIVVLEGRRGAHRFTVRLTAEPFRKSRHRIVETEDEIRIDGRRALGTSGVLPDLELTGFSVTVDGRRWRVPPALWRDCFEPALYVNPRYPTVQAALTPTGDRLWVKLHGGDGHYSYRVIWNLRRDGRHTRQVSDDLCR